MRPFKIWEILIVAILWGALLDQFAELYALPTTIVTDLALFMVSSVLLWTAIAMGYFARQREVRHIMEQTREIIDELHDAVIRSAVNAPRT